MKENEDLKFIVQTLMPRLDSLEANGTVPSWGDFRGHSNNYNIWPEMAEFQTVSGWSEDLFLCWTLVLSQAFTNRGSL
jgi:hypothetical protein